MPKMCATPKFCMFFILFQARDLMVDATDAHCIAAAIEYFGLQSQDDDPNKNLPPSQQANTKVKKGMAVPKCFMPY